ncbi:E3 ubiquitin-protein ligase RNF14 isoform X2 [Cephus cinctus]|uniref:RBR-type E3 ubiquitin transferase n=1 Tax=Cephus cinctus TaxID=211228 RepID=A0AAJ7FP08_CEPCN|nr:E3 ubiquitin-protein ligase RNF14 isoform X2 [Cephus cinctus]XP_024943726.1 E3 ubiquitin-protein ligase RNF14 isoform X2 [Cephus cinctus]XP_024943727.1 E3 ubiquitin-protein ligase RNF14 isoform X2 [Cephus cinctus]
MDCEKQKDEIIALESIYNEEEFSYHEENNKYECTLKIFINLPYGYHFTYRDSRQPNQSVEKVPISHLPPLTLFITLPPTYPSESSPIFKLCSSWLSQPVLAKLCKKLDQLWEENKGQEILFTWIAFLKNETLEFLNIQNSVSINSAYTFYKVALEKAQNAMSVIAVQHENVKENETTDEKSVDYQQDTSKNVIKSKENKKPVPKKKYRKQKCKKINDQRAISDRPIGKNPVQMLVNYNIKRKQVEFKKNFYTCKICFADKMGEHCTQFLPCSHIFCKDCIIGYLEVRIKEGSVQNIYCPEEKCTSEATPGQVKDLVSPELFDKYDSILLSTTLHTMMDIVYCPRPHCQYPVSREPNERMANCPACQYAFCVYCKMVYHGIEPCKLKSVEKQQLVMEYQKASDERKIHLEERYGKKQLLALVHNTMSEMWIDEYTKKCPECNAAIEKSDGCNKMICWRCNTYFCWICGGRLNHKSPYLHFRDPESKCYKKLFRQVLIPLDPGDPEYDEDNLDFPAVYLGNDSDDENFSDDVFNMDDELS